MGRETFNLINQICAVKNEKRKINDSGVGKVLSEWFSLITNCGVHISRSMLKANAEDLAQKMVRGCGRLEFISNVHVCTVKKYEFIISIL